MELTGILTYAITALTFAGIYGILSLSLNMHWGMAGLFNVGIAGFFSVGAYTQAILTASGSPLQIEANILVGYIASMAFSGALAVVIGLITVRLRTDYLAIASIGIAEIIRLIIKNEDWLTDGVTGITGVPRPFDGLFPNSPLVMLCVVGIGLYVTYWCMERARTSPWGRVVRAIRENEMTVQSVGKDVEKYRLQAFVVGAVFMGLAGAFYGQYTRFVSPDAFDPLYGTFIIWVMLIAGGSGNNKGAVLGSVAIWFIWSMTEFVINLLPPEQVTQGGALRVLLIGVFLQAILLTRPEGLLPETFGKEKGPGDITNENTRASNPSED